MAWRLNLAGNSARLPNVSIRTFGPNGLATWGAAGFAGCEAVGALGGAADDAPPGAADFAAVTVRERAGRSGTSGTRTVVTSACLLALGRVPTAGPSGDTNTPGPSGLSGPSAAGRRGPVDYGRAIAAPLHLMCARAHAHGHASAQSSARPARCARRSDRAHRRRAGAGAGLPAPTGRGARGARAPRARIAHRSSVAPAPAFSRP